MKYSTYLPKPKLFKKCFICTIIIYHYKNNVIERDGISLLIFTLKDSKISCYAAIINAKVNAINIYSGMS